MGYIVAMQNHGIENLLVAPFIGGFRQVAVIVTETEIIVADHKSDRPWWDAIADATGGPLQRLAKGKVSSQQFAKSIQQTEVLRAMTQSKNVTRFQRRTLRECKLRKGFSGVEFIVGGRETVQLSIHRPRIAADQIIFALDLVLGPKLKQESTFGHQFLEALMGSRVPW